MSTISQAHRQVLSYFYAILAIVGICAMLLVVALDFGYAADVRERDRFETFHLHGLRLAGELSTRVSELQSDLLGVGATARGSSHGDPIRAAIAEIDQPLAALSSLPDDDEGLPFRSTVARAVRQYAELGRLYEQGGDASSEFTEQLAALEMTAFQLQRLHAVAAEAMLHEVARFGQQRNTRAALFLLAALLVSGLLVWKTHSLLRANLLKQARTEEELLVRERQLQQSSKMEALGTLVGGISHDFNNLLTAILANAEVLQWQMEPDDPRSADLQEITKAAERAAMLTRQLLAFSRQESIEPRVLDINFLLRDIEPLLRRLLPSDISLATEYGSGLCDVEFDAVQFEQVIVNLAVNARDAMPDGGALTIRTSDLRTDGTEPEGAVPAGRYARISIADTGCGMDAETRDRIFEPFFTTKELGKGTGLGLSTVHGIIKQSRGYIAVESAPHRGATFEILLPQASGQTEGDRAPDLETAESRGSGTVLLAEDQEQIRELAAAGLRTAGYNVLVAGDGEQALELCRGSWTDVDLVVTDIVMPGLRGPALVERVLDLYPRARVIYISGYSESQILEDVLKSGAPLVRKPFKLQELLAVVAAEMAEARRSLAGSS